MRYKYLTLLLLVFLGCNTYKKYEGVYKSRRHHFYQSIHLKKDGSYLMHLASDISNQKGKGSWYPKKDTIILNSEYIKDEIDLVRLKDNSLNIENFSVIEIKAKYNEKYYDVIDCTIMINDSIKIYPKETIKKDENFTSIQVRAKGMTSKTIPFELDSDTLKFWFDIPSGDSRIYPFFKNQKCLVNDDNLLILDGRPPKMKLIRQKKL